MLCSLLTVVFYAASSLGDKFISAKLDCNAREFSFLVSAATALFLALMLPFFGWRFDFSCRALVILLLLIAFKIGEFYTSAYLLKTVSAYELKAWLSINVILSYLVDLGRGKETFFWAFIPCAAALLVGIGMIAFAHRSEGEDVEEDVKKAGFLYILFSLAYIASKFLYGLAINELNLTSEASRVSVLLLVMVGVALLQLPFVRFKTFFHKKGLLLGALTRLPNAAGLWTEAIAAQQNLLLYSLMQPMQLLILFATALIRREKLGKAKLIGSIPLARRRHGHDGTHLHQQGDNMIRTFQTHRIRRQQELTERLWQFTALSGENAGKSFPVATPSCWETYPGFGLHRGEGKYETTFCAAGILASNARA